MYPDSDSIISWRGVEIPHFPVHYGYVYLIHFNEPYKHAKHYLGSAICLEHRLARHRAGTGARLMEVITEAGISWEVSKIWRCDSPEEARVLESRLKGWHHDGRLCPTCQHRDPDPLAMLYAGHHSFSLYSKPGRRRPMGGYVMPEQHSIYST